MRAPRLAQAASPARQVPALCYMVDRSHVQYAGRLPLAEQLHHVRQGHGQSGPNRDYVIATVAAMEALGLRESELHLLAERLKGTHEGGRVERNSTGAAFYKSVPRLVECRRNPRCQSWCSGRLVAPSSRSPSAISRAVAVSIACCRRSKNTCLSSPGAIGSRNSATIVPG